MLEKIILFPYYLTLKVRHLLYDKGVKKVYTTEKPSICVGNIAVGGTGKTPHTEMVLNTLLHNDFWGDKNVSVLSRGHKRSSRSFQQVTLDGSAAFFGDEPLQIKKNFPIVTVAVDRNRVEGCGFLFHPETLETSKAGRKCIDKNIPPADIVVLDDGFQYRNLKYDYNIILTDYGRPVKKDCLLPLGHLRDLPERLNYAHTIIVTKCPAWLEDWEKTKYVRNMGIRDYDLTTGKGIGPRGQVQTVLFTSINYVDIKPIYEEADRHYLYSKKLILFSGIAKDTPLMRFLSDKYQIVRRFKFADHHKFRKRDIRSILNAAREFPTAVVVTTEKDSQRLLDFKNMPAELKTRLFQIPIRVDFLSKEEQNIFEKELFIALSK